MSQRTDRAELRQPTGAATTLGWDAPAVELARQAETDAYSAAGLEPTEHRVEVPELDCRIRVVEAGRGPPVVVIPGGVGFGVIWTPLFPELDGHRFLVMDRPGGGLSDGFDYRRVPVATIAATSTAAVFDYFELDSAPVVGNSLGGLWALRFAIEHSDRVSAIALLGCPAAYPRTSAPLSMRLLTLPLVGRRLVGPMMQSDDVEDARGTIEWLGHPADTAQELPDAFVEAWHRMEQLPHFIHSWTSILRAGGRLRGLRPEWMFTPDDLGDVDAPVLLLWGSDDPFGSVEAGRAGVEFFEEASFHEVGVGHLPWLDEPERCGALLESFLDRHG